MNLTHSYVNEKEKITLERYIVTIQYSNNTPGYCWPAILDTYRDEGRQIISTYSSVSDLLGISIGEYVEILKKHGAKKQSFGDTCFEEKNKPNLKPLLRELARLLIKKNEVDKNASS